MSLKIMSMVWEDAPYAEGTLLTLLALADWANDDGRRVFPKIKNLAAKARLSERQVQRALKTLRDDNVIIATHNSSGGSHKGVEYQINLQRVTNWHGCHSKQKRVTPMTRTGDIKSPVKDILPSIQPSNKQPSILSSESSDAQTVLELYNSIAAKTGWPVASRLTSKRRASIPKRLSEIGGLDGWRVAMQKAEASPFCRGETGRTNGHEKWTPDLDFFLQESSLTKLMEGKYDDRRPARPDTSFDASLRAAESVLASRRQRRENGGNGQDYSPATFASGSKLPDNEDAGGSESDQIPVVLRRS